MKYVKTYENFNLGTFFNKFRNLIEDLMKDKKLLLTKYKNDGFWIQEEDPRTTRHFNYQQKFFNAQFFHLNDKKMREIPFRDREKIGLSFKYTLRNLKQETEFCKDLSNFLTSVMKKYSYYTKNDSYLGTSSYTFYIKTSDTENILSEIKTEFKLFIDINKYNL